MPLEARMLGPLQQKYMDSVSRVGDKIALDLLGKLDELYVATNDLMAEIGAHGSIDPTGELSDRVMNALYDIDGGQTLTGVVAKINEGK